MGLSSLSPTQLAGAQIALSVVLAVAGFALLLPRPRGRSIAGGIALLVASGSVLGAWLYSVYGQPMPDTIGSILFTIFALGAIGFGTVLVVQRNPARGAIAFAFVILSTAGLFLLLAAPFLMAATIIVYAGAIIVTFLFVLMLSQNTGPSDENDRSREPLIGSLAGLAFTGLILFTIYLSALGRQSVSLERDSAAATRKSQPLPGPVLTREERQLLDGARMKLDASEGSLGGEGEPKAGKMDYFEGIRNDIAAVVGSVQPARQSSIQARLERKPRHPLEPAVPYRLDAQTRAILDRSKAVREANDRAFAAVENHLVEGKPAVDVVRADLQTLRGELLLLSGSSDLPAHNVSNLGFELYSQNLLAIELAGTLLLVATVGAIVISRRKAATA